MRRSWLILLLMMPRLPGQEAVRTRYLPALAYGRNIWSIVRLTNSGSRPQSVPLTVYREDGAPLPLAPAYEVAAGATVDVRVDGKADSEEMCWARVALPAGVEAIGLVEILQGNTLEDYPRQPHDVSADDRWVAFSSRVEGRQVYFLNAGGPTEVSFCATDDAAPHACEKKRKRSARFHLGPNQSLAVEVHKLRGRFFITESSAPAAAVLVLFDDGGGIKKVFGSKTSIDFGEALP